MSFENMPGQARKRRGSGRATIHDVAKLAGVGSITVSRYLKKNGYVSEELGARIDAAVAQLNYVPNLAAGGLSSAHNKVVGMVVPNISGPIFASTIQGFNDTLTRHGYQLLLASSYFSAEQEENAVRAFLGWSPAALAVVGRFHSRGTEALLAAAGIPVVETWDYAPRRKPIQVGYSNREVGVQAARHLLAKGYRRIAFVQNSVAGDLSALDRRDGYAATLEEHGLEPWTYAPTEEAPFDAGRQALEALTRSRRGGRKAADAIIFANDNLAAGALLASQRAGLQVPQRCALMGFGDYAFSPLLLPSLTTIRPPGREIGEIAAQRILQALGELPAEPKPARLNLLECALIEREST
ncbi:LacI family DNA-binding transcriptional regulator [Pseudoduganella albidiflava]|uniref:LacI family DNA-binding transcriptional regulator n=1 Tax=Pseudoduganella albidiflava TaxID=321983 RepID=A0A411X4H5_9BURK|nr:LacI family DNA-binding transcriptional regulator [Pseudoduganella albidiflava]QBI03919.1 LacI family DNA-binding transcriptional regulator [Pseudoduganella albidiflava]GGY23277.1 LacI family transcriptional regulator [Pseudoduganella albidiflava]